MIRENLIIMTRKFTKCGRIAAFFMAFLIAFTGVSSFAVQTAEASSGQSRERSEEDLGAMLSVATVIGKDWDKDEKFRSYLSQRDSAASDYAKQHNLIGVFNTSVSLGKYESSSETGGEWISNVLYAGDILRSDTFDGFTVVYGQGADAVVIEEGINEIDAILIPGSDMNISYSGKETDISSWKTIPGFASRMMLQDLDGNDSLNLSGKKAYRTKLFIVGVSGTELKKSNIYSTDGMLDYTAFLNYIGARASSANLLSYMAYIRVYSDLMQKYRDYLNTLNGFNSWYEWFQQSSDHQSSGSSSHDDDMASYSYRTIMIYMDGGNLGTYAVNNLAAILRASATGSIGDANHIVIMTGGSKEKWFSDRNDDLYNMLYESDGETPYSGAGLGLVNQLWEVRDGKLVLIENGFNDGGYMTQGSNLAAFIKAVKDEYPDSELYDLILWDHGGGPEDGYGQDERNAQDHSMPMKDIVEALEEGGIDFDFICFDACLMSSAEVALILAPYTKYLVASELLLPGEGLNDDGYDTLVSYLIEDNNIDTRTYLQSIVDSSISYYEKNPDDATLAIFDSEKVSSELADALEGFATVIMDALADNNKAALEHLLYNRKGYQYTETKTNRLYSRDLIDIQTFCDALKQSEAHLPERDRIFTDACNDLFQAVENCIISFRSTYREPDTVQHAQGCYAHGMSFYFPTFSMTVFPYDYTDPYDDTSKMIDQVEDIVEAAYNSSDRLSLYGKSLAAYGLWLKVGESLGDATFWTDENDEDVRYDVYHQDDPKFNLNKLKSISGLTDAEVDAVIRSMIEGRIRKDRISVAKNDEDSVRIVTVKTSDSDITDRVEVSVSVKDADGKIISLGKSNMYSTKTAEEYNPFFVNKYDNKWLTIGDKVVSYYDSEVRGEDDTNYRYGLIPVALWYDKNDDNKLTLKEAIDQDKVMVGVFEVRFPLVGENFSDTGEVINFRGVFDNSLAMSGYSVDKDQIYELLAGFDSGKDTRELRSIGAIQIGNTTDYNEDSKSFTAVFKPIKDIDIQYSIVDAYESKYSLTAKNFPDADGSKDLRNLDGFRDDYDEQQTYIEAPETSETVADQSGFTRHKEEERVVRSAADTSAGNNSSPEKGQAAANEIELTTEQTDFLNNIRAEIQAETITMDQASELITAAGITPEIVDTYTSSQDQTGDSEESGGMSGLPEVSEVPEVSEEPETAEAPASGTESTADIPEADNATEDNAGLTDEKITSDNAGIDSADPSTEIEDVNEDAGLPKEEAGEPEESTSPDPGSDGGSGEGETSDGSDDGGSGDDSILA